MGSVIIKMEAGKTYKALVTYPDSSKATISLPTANNDGYVLSVAEAGFGQLKVTVVSAKENRAQQFNIAAQSGGVIYYFATGKLNNENYTVLIPKNKFPAGITQFTLFSKEGEPLGERLVFIRNDEAAKLNIGTDKPRVPCARKNKSSFNSN